MSDPVAPYRQFIENARRFQEEATEILRGDDKIIEHYADSDLPLLIGLGGKLAAGKDTVADYLVSAHGFEKLGMSDPLATALYTLNPWIQHGSRSVISDRDDEHHFPTFARYRDLIDVHGYTEAKRIPEVRRLLQVLGTEVGRDQLGEDTWTNVASRRITEIRESGKPVVLTGVRFQNERRMVAELSGNLVWIERPEPNLLAFGDPSGPGRRQWP